MSCYKYWDKIKSIASSLKKYDDYQLDDITSDDIISILDDVEIIAHDQAIDFCLLYTSFYFIGDKNAKYIH